MQRRRRAVGGVAMLLAAVALVFALRATGAAPVWRSIAFLPLLGGMLGLLQARGQTCVALAARGERNLDRGTERVSDPAELRLQQHQSRRILARPSSSPRGSRCCSSFGNTVLRLAVRRGRTSNVEPSHLAPVVSSYLGPRAYI